LLSREFSSQSSGVQIASFLCVLYCHLLSVWAYHIFLQYFTHGTIFLKKVPERKMRVLIFSTSLSQNILIPRMIQRDININVRKSLCKVHVTLVRSEFSRQNFETSSDTRSHMKIRPVGSELFHADGQTGRHDETNSCFSQCCEGS
jgi:hypothetical protein